MLLLIIEFSIKMKNLFLYSSEKILSINGLIFAFNLLFIFLSKFK